jgi:hypothetical protein
MAMPTAVSARARIDGCEPGAGRFSGNELVGWRSQLWRFGWSSVRAFDRRAAELRETWVWAFRNVLIPTMLSDRNVLRVSSHLFTKVARHTIRVEKRKS